MNRNLLKPVLFIILFSACIQAQWVKTGFIGRSVQDIAVKDSVLYALSQQSFYISRDNGAVWDSLSSFDGIEPRHILFLNDTIFVYANWAIVSEDPIQDRPCVFRSDDGGHTWKTLLSSFLGASSMTIIGSTIFCTVDPKHILKSTDYGASWDTLASIPPSLVYINYLFSHNKNLYAAQIDYLMFRSPDGGLNWKDISAGLQPLGFNLMFANSKYLFIDKDSILYRSTDEGENWDTLEIPLKPHLSIFNAIATDSLIFLTGFIEGTTLLKVYAGTIKDNKWKDISDGLYEETFILPFSMAAKDNRLFLAASRELWKYDLSHLLAVEDNPAPVKTFSLSQNYPNPFNPSTQISFHLAEGSKVTIRVYDLLGKEAAVLMDEYKSAGTHTVQFNASNLPSGMYIYQLRAGEHTSMRKMLLIK